ncbi:MAG: GtrA family protein [Lachnospiraceae bacterium]|nr:GtrA family protein [Lachnospiraceae bacterium]
MNGLFDNIINGIFNGNITLFATACVLAAALAVAGTYLMYKILSREIFTYIIAGLLTTVVNIAASFLFHDILKWNENLVTILAWIVAVAFAYVINNSWVFQSKYTGVKDEIIKIAKFVAGRIFTYFVEAIPIYILITRMGYDKYYWIIKFILIVIVTILNYFFSKFLVFLNKPESAEKSEMSKEKQGEAQEKQD